MLPLYISKRKIIKIEEVGTSGFNALPSGFRSDGGGYSTMGSHSFFWSTMMGGSGYPFGRHMINSLSSVWRFDAYAVRGGAIRCLKD